MGERSMMTPETKLLLQYGLLGIALLYFYKKEQLWELERAKWQAKYEELIKEATRIATELKAQMQDVGDAIQKCKGAKNESVGAA